ncbi:hypothetical protein C7T94_02105 [Pedobacter yulinensis]|uniref:RND transporter n=1 Tax=Pedobacter yulinensis TaxID=2126353 RepID=A0A2T3HRC2_9SPHI|nr:efflux transporter outer membrane subunit [Pedobacter yulinensis]PST84937.1 hypothetical protein C7T94_02105 [Pedobacter yulinensis]
MTQFKKYTLLFMLLLLGAGACVTRQYERPAVPDKGLYRDVQSADTNSIGQMRWDSLFTDPVLQSLVREGLEKNLDLRSAMERIKSADAALRQSRAAFLPSLSADVSVADNKQSRAALNFPPGININLETQTYRAQLSTSWEADIWGKLSSGRRAALATLLQTEAAKRAIQTQLISNIANNYYALLALDKQLAITEETIRIRIQDVETMKALKEGAVVNGAAVVQSEANRYAAEVTVPDLKRSIRETENALSILLARAPGTIVRGKLENQVPLASLETGISSQLLQNRPDVQQAEFAFRAAFENTNVARTFFYPSLTLTAAGGLSSLQLQNFFSQSIFYNIVGGLTQPIFNRGQNKARLRSAQASQQIAYNDFQQSLLNAGNEVSNYLYAYQAATDKQDSRSKQIASLTKAVDYTKELLRYSSATNYTDVLTSEQALLSAQLAGVNDQLQKLQAVVNLYRALGGGWR